MEKGILQKSCDSKNAMTEPKITIQAQEINDKVAIEAGKETIVLMRNVYLLASESIYSAYSTCTY